MSTYTSEPGTRLAGRYRLVDQVSSGTGWTYWKATDETLARSVTVLTFATGFPRIAETVTAARAASRLGDPRFSQVFDVEDGEELAYVVLEWVAAESLLDMLSEGPLDPARAAALMVEAARAIAGAHNIGLAHLRLDPACLHWTAGGGVKIVGLGIDAALAGSDPKTLTVPGEGTDDPELIDTQDLARLLYAALTGYWPGQPDSAGSVPGPRAGGKASAAAARAGERLGTVHAAPGFGGRAGRRRRRDLPGAVPAAEPARPGAEHRGDVRRRPGQRRPADAVAVCCRSRASHQGRPVRLRLPAGRAARPVPARRQRRTLGRTPGPRPRPGGGRKPPGKRSAAVRAVIGAVIVLVLAAVGVAAWSISRSLHHSATPPPAGTHSPSQSAAAAIRLSAGQRDRLQPARQQRRR